jgi:hypothetical protein
LGKGTRVTPKGTTQLSHIQIKLSTPQCGYLFLETTCQEGVGITCW